MGELAEALAEQQVRLQGLGCHLDQAVLQPPAATRALPLPLRLTTMEGQVEGQVELRAEQAGQGRRRAPMQRGELPSSASRWRTRRPPLPLRWRCSRGPTHEDARVVLRKQAFAAAAAGCYVDGRKGFDSVRVLFAAHIVLRCCPLAATCTTVRLEVLELQVDLQVSTISGSGVQPVTVGPLLAGLRASTGTGGSSCSVQSAVCASCTTPPHAAAGAAHHCRSGS